MSNHDQLLTAFHTTSDDLLANRAGRLGPGQARRVRSNAWANVFGFEVFVACLIALVYVETTGAVEVSQHVVAGILALVGVLLFVGLTRKPFAATRAATVECLAGPVTLEVRNRTQWWLTVAGRSYRLPVAASTIAPLAPYRVYVVPHLDKIVAMEPDGWD